MFAFSPNQCGWAVFFFMLHSKRVTPFPPLPPLKLFHHMALHHKDAENFYFTAFSHFRFRCLPAPSTSFSSAPPLLTSPPKLIKPPPHRETDPLFRMNRPIVFCKHSPLSTVLLDQTLRAAPSSPPPHLSTLLCKMLTNLRKQLYPPMG